MERIRRSGREVFEGKNEGQIEVREERYESKESVTRTSYNVTQVLLCYLPIVTTTSSFPFDRFLIKVV